MDLDPVLHFGAHAERVCPVDVVNTDHINRMAAPSHPNGQTLREQLDAGDESWWVVM